MGAFDFYVGYSLTSKAAFRLRSTYARGNLAVTLRIHHSLIDFEISRTKKGPRHHAKEPISPGAGERALICRPLSVPGREARDGGTDHDGILGGG